MPLSPRDVAEAQAAQEDYWNVVAARLTFCRKIDVAADSTTLDAVFDRPNYVDRNYFRGRCVETYENGYVWLSKYWADRFLNYYLGYVWLEVYTENRKLGLNEKKASAAADADRVEKVKSLKEQFP